MIDLRLSVKKWISIVKFLGLASVCCLLVVSCNGRPNANQTTTPNTATSNRLSVGTTLKPRTLDPADNYELAGSNVMTSLSDRLYTYKIGTSELEPQLATALPKISADGLTYTIPLRQGVIFHDDTPFNAEAMAFSLNRFISNGGKPAALLSDVVQSVTASADYELTIKLKTAFAAFPSLLAFPGMCAVSPKAYELGVGKFKPGTFVGTGPYKLVEFSPQLVKMDAFPKYWGTKPPNTGIDYQILSSSANLYNTFIKGGVDVAYLAFSPDQVESLKQQANQKGWQALEERSNVVTHMMLNVKQKPLDNVVVRQALAYAIDRSLITDRVYRKQAEALYSMIPSTFDSYEPIFQTKYGDGNIVKAKELLAQAGYNASNPLKLEVFYPATSTTREQIASTLREYASQKLAGIVEIQPQAAESTAFFGNIGKGLYQIALLDWYPDFGDPDNYIQPFLGCAKGSESGGCTEGASQSQGSFYYSDRMNKLIAQQRQEQNPQARQKIFTEIQQLAATDVPAVPLVQTKDYAFAQKGLQGLQIDPILKLPLWLMSKG
jgi:peptide/nickel transport system substrate-binding protein